MKKIIQKLNYQPHSLTKYEINDPLSVLTDFFIKYELHDVRENLWEIYTGWSNSFFAESKKNLEILTLYQDIINLINATYLYNEKQKMENRPV